MRTLLKCTHRPRNTYVIAITPGKIRRCCLNSEHVPNGRAPVSPPTRIPVTVNHSGSCYRLVDFNHVLCAHGTCTIFPGQARFGNTMQSDCCCHLADAVQVAFANRLRISTRFPRNIRVIVGLLSFHWLQLLLLLQQVAQLNAITLQ